MREVSGPIIAIALVLCAVFVPLAFISGLTGQFYKQFALTIAISTVISAINSLTLSPALAALLLKGHDAPKDWLTRRWTACWAASSRASTASSTAAASATAAASRRDRARPHAGVYAVLRLTVGMFHIVPGGFVPAQDKQYLVGFAQLPDGATLDRTEAVIRRMGDIALKQPGVESAGLPRPVHQRLHQQLQRRHRLRDPQALRRTQVAGAVGGRHRRRPQPAVRGHPGGLHRRLPAPPVMGLGTVGGFKMQIEDRAAWATPSWTRPPRPSWPPPPRRRSWGRCSPATRSTCRSWTWTWTDQGQAAGRGVTDVFDTLQIYLGSLYVNDFNRFGRVYQVRAQADADFRAQPEDIARLKTRNASGEMVPWVPCCGSRPPTARRWWCATTASPPPTSTAGRRRLLLGPGRSGRRAHRRRNPAPGREVRMDRPHLPEDPGGQRRRVGLPISVLLVFLVLAAQYESLTLPLAVILIVPMSILAP
jgi:multidrug efflux pump